MTYLKVGDQVWHRTYRCLATVVSTPRAHAQIVRLQLAGNTSARYFSLNELKTSEHGEPITAVLVRDPATAPPVPMLPKKAEPPQIDSKLLSSVSVPRDPDVELLEPETPKNDLETLENSHPEQPVDPDAPLWNNAHKVAAEANGHRSGGSLMRPPFAEPSPAQPKVPNVPRKASHAPLEIERAKNLDAAYGGDIHLDSLVRKRDELARHLGIIDEKILQLRIQLLLKETMNRVKFQEDVENRTQIGTDLMQLRKEIDALQHQLGLK